MPRSKNTWTQTNAEHITLDTLTGLTHMNKYYMVHSFTKYAGLSPIQYLNQTRLKRAQHLLKKYQLFDFLILRPPPDFSSQSYFTQIFRKNFKYDTGEIPAGTCKELNFLPEYPDRYTKRNALTELSMIAFLFLLSISKSHTT